MPERVLLDNDVVMKVACYGLTEETVAVATIDNVPPAMLGVGRFVVRSRLARASNIADPVRAAAAFDQMLAGMTMVEPDDAEMATAADLEAEAIRRDVELDGGESQLLAMLVNRACKLLITGDKRAIAAMAIVAQSLVSSRVACFEQLIGHVTSANGARTVRPLICSEPKVDRAITSCFACSSPIQPDDSDVMGGLASYVGHLNRSAAGVLIPGHDLSSLAA